MRIKFWFSLGLILSLFLITAQNKKILFGFDEIPQSLMVNPGASVKYKFHSGIPALSGIYINAGLTGFNIADLFADDGIDVNSKLRDILQETSRNDYYTVNQQVEIFNAGFRLKNPRKDYISFGYYQEFDAILYHPKDIITLAFEGNEELGRAFDLADISFKAELIGVYHLGINRKMNDDLTIGLRGKIYSSVYNATSTVNSGTFITTVGENNFYNHSLINTDLSLQTSGSIEDRVLGKFLMSSNMGLGIDFGLTYRLKEHLEIKASLQDLGFIWHTKNIESFEIKGTQNFEGLNLVFPTTDNIEYWQNLENDFANEIILKESDANYITARSVKLNGGLTYKYGKTKEDDCIRSYSKNPNANGIGIQLFGIFRPRKPQLAATLFYYRHFSKYLRAKITYTADDFSYKNIGLGVSTHLSKFNFYITADNLLGYSDLSKSNNQSIQLGFNLIY